MPEPVQPVRSVPRVVFVVPCFNHGAFVGDAVRSCLGQSLGDIRVVVVDDGSTDGTTPGACDACSGLGAPGQVQIVHQANAGLPAARNAGARSACQDQWCEYLVFLDADDWVEPTFVERLYGAIVEADDARVSHAYCQEKLVELGKGVWQVPEWDPVLLLITNLHPVTALIRRWAFEEVGGFDAGMNQGYEDWEFWLRLSSPPHGYRGVRVREPLFIWRRHSQTTMVMDAVKRHETLFAQIMDRHRGLYQQHALELVARSNQLLRRADANWLDENHEAIFIRDLRAWNWDLVRERDEAYAKIAELERAVERLTADAREALAASGRLAALEGHERSVDEAVGRVRAEYEAKPSVKLGRAIFRVVDASPKPVANVVRAAVRGVRKGLG